MKGVKIVWWMIWGALTMSALMYLVMLQMGVMGEVELEAGDEHVDGKLRSILLKVSLVSFTISLLVHFFITKPQVKKRVGADVMKVLPGFIVSLALAESSAIYGLLLGMQGMPFEQYIQFFVVSYAALLLIAPVYLLRK